MSGFPAFLSCFLFVHPYLRGEDRLSIHRYKHIMARSQQQLRQQIAQIEQELRTLGEAFQQSYEAYLQRLRQVVPQQLIVAVYHLCTQVYPEAFLKLSFSQRQRLQEEMRRLGQQMPEDLAVLVQWQDAQAEAAQRHLFEQLIQKLPHPTEDQPPEPGDRPQNTEDKETDRGMTDQEVAMEIWESLWQRRSGENPQDSALTGDPEELSRWGRHLERQLRRLLDSLSRRGNHVLHDFHLIAKDRLRKFMEAALEAEGPGTTVSGPPNLLTLLVDDGEEEDSDGVEITALHLRLGELEFIDPSLAQIRQKLNGHWHSWKGLKRRHQSVKKDLTIAEAESAWRASWYEDP